MSKCRRRYARTSDRFSPAVHLYHGTDTERRHLLPTQQARWGRRYVSVCAHALRRQLILVGECMASGSDPTWDLPAMLMLGLHNVPLAHSFPFVKQDRSTCRRYMRTVYCQNGEQVSRTVLTLRFQLVSRGPPGSWHMAGTVCENAQKFGNIFG